MGRTTAHRIEIIGLPGFPEIRAGDDLVSLVLSACRSAAVDPTDGDVFVLTQKIISKSEGRVVSLRSVSPSPLAAQFAEQSGRDARAVEVALREARRVVKMDRGILITETAHGFVCANSGVDASNVPDPDAVSILPMDPDRSAEEIRRRLHEVTGKSVAVVITDTFGRPWREGLTNVAIGVAGMSPYVDYRGREDVQGKALSTTLIAAADELAAAAELVMGKLERVPAALVRGYDFTPAAGKARSLLRSPERDLFR